MERPLGLMLVIALTFGLGVNPLRADAVEGAAVSSSDRSTIASCLQESADAPRACIGTIAVVCSRQGTGDRRDAEMDCSRREAAVWRERLDAASTALSERLESAPRNRFAAVQRSWEDYFTQKCAFIADVQPSARAPITQAGCELREVATRAIEVERLVRRQSNPESPRPKLER